ncbi:MAG: methylated-DNA--[protein]-cysteine S-methyltransferase [Acidobacteria bacterium]|nr:methylated-DNA--[protein]-cysteine S-methyltransferase [Acidobacteriota bacterium]MCK6683023.1 methylated-DNA--[protein]-cysteine S-methyltransferase [Thermoanaerobaculia bacterium]
MGFVTTVLDASRVKWLLWAWDRKKLEAQLSRDFGKLPVPDSGPSVATAKAIEAYFGGDVHALDSLDADPDGTEFQKEVWRKLRQVKPGKTVTYAGLAELTGRPNAFRACGMANARNPVPLIIPCHRVVASNGIGGYSSGLDRKKWLLKHEGAVV